MPYIKPERRGEPVACAGELNYAITTLVVQYLKDRGESYQTYNDIVGVLECAKIELYRRKVGAYEDVKAVDNGDVY